MSDHRLSKDSKKYFLKTIYIPIEESDTWDAFVGYVQRRKKKEKDYSLSKGVVEILKKFLKSTTRIES